MKRHFQSKTMMAPKKRSATKGRSKGPAATHRAPADEHAATELVLYIENTSDLSPDGPRGQGRDVLLNALRKWRKGTYDPTLAVRLFEYLTESGAKRYAKEMGSSEKEYDHVDTRIGAPSTLRESGSSLYDKLKAADQQLDHHESDLYVKWTPEANAIIRAHGGPEAANARSFTGQDGERWIDIPFAYTPWWEKRQRSAPSARVRENEDDWRKYSMTYGELPPFEKFERDIRRSNPDNSDGSAYWPAGTLYPMELVAPNEIVLAEDFGELDEFEPERRRTGRHSGVRGFRGNEKQIYDFLAFLIDQFGDEYEGYEEAGDLASSIMTTLGYEWI